ncbi:MAG TPA: D-sedoheptulose 7-phosphate isomerase [bacterium]
MAERVENRITSYFEESVAANVDFARKNWKDIFNAAKAIASALKKGNKLLLFGNGGSAADAQHIAAEFVNRFQMERKPLPAISLTTDTSVLTSISNDYDFKEIFSKQIMAIGKKGDIAVGITTSGNSPNVLSGLRQARRMRMTTIGILGKDGGAAKKECRIPLIVECGRTSIVQEVHITLLHAICIIVDEILFGNRKQ